MKMKRFVIEAVLDKSYFEKIKNRNVFRYRMESIHRTFRAISLKRAKHLAAKHLSLLLKQNNETGIITAYLYQETHIRSSQLRRVDLP